MLLKALDFVFCYLYSASMFFRGFYPVTIIYCDTTIFKMCSDGFLFYFGIVPLLLTLVQYQIECTNNLNIKIYSHQLDILLIMNFASIDRFCDKSWVQTHDWDNDFLTNNECVS